jgi:hypothetical protein
MTVIDLKCFFFIEKLVSIAIAEITVRKNNQNQKRNPKEALKKVSRNFLSRKNLISNVARLLFFIHFKATLRANGLLFFLISLK